MLEKAWCAPLTHELPEAVYARTQKSSPRITPLQVQGQITVAVVRFLARLAQNVDLDPLTLKKLE